MLAIITNPFEDLLVIHPVRLATCDLVERAGVVDLCATRERMMARVKLSKALRESGVIDPEDLNLYEDGWLN
ncbi:hypothetical protein MTBLM1_130020 [Rhodospirillaceae bacterium LM-1]|nr:hypothetical protein MTBLM1_130020 [Rhodospirillaceae bacterium LM-1]